MRLLTLRVASGFSLMPRVASGFGLMPRVASGLTGGAMLLVESLPAATKPRVESVSAGAIVRVASKPRVESSLIGCGEKVRVASSGCPVDEPPSGPSIGVKRDVPPHLINAIQPPWQEVRLLGGPGGTGEKAASS